VTTADRPRVLVVDDHAVIRERVTGILSQTCETVDGIGDGETALVLIGILKPDVVVLDISLPGINGFEVAIRLRQGGSTVPIVFLSSYDDEDLKRAAKAAGANVYVVKSHLSDLVAAVRQAWLADRAGLTFSKGMGLDE
jgi:two-component system OmpR family response regulator